MEAATEARIFNDFVCCFGIPMQLYTDQGRNFESPLIKEICKVSRIIHTCIKYHPLLAVTRSQPIMHSHHNQITVKPWRMRKGYGSRFMCECVCYRTSSYKPGLCVQSEAIYSFLYDIYCVDFTENVLFGRYGIICLPQWLATQLFLDKTNKHQ